MDFKNLKYPISDQAFIYRSSFFTGAFAVEINPPESA